MTSDRLHFHMRRRGNLPSGEHMVVNAGIRRFPGQAGYFTTTADLYTNKGQSARGIRENGRGMIGGGAMLDEIAERFPSLRPVVALHMSDEVTGEPMHADANAVYWYRKGDGPADEYGRHGTGYDMFARHCRIPRAQVPEGMSDGELRAFLVNLRPMWRYQAHKARRVLRAD
jgi:hypothetical protein